MFELYDNHNDYRDYLSHHGILGQKWGKRNGPPYPLGASDHSASEKRAGWQRSLNNKSYGFKNKKNKNNNIVFGEKELKLDNKQTEEKPDKKDKKPEIHTVSPYEEYSDLNVPRSKHQKNESDKSEAEYYCMRVLRDSLGLKPISFAKDLIRIGKAKKAMLTESKLHAEAENKLKTGEMKKDSETGFNLIGENKGTEQAELNKVNPGFMNFDANTKNNCVLCSITYEMRRRGYDVTANKSTEGYNYTDIKHWFKDTEMKKGYDPKYKYQGDDYSDWVDNEWVDSAARALRGQNHQHAEVLSKRILREPKNSRGVLFVTWPYGGGHAVAYEVGINKKDGSKKLIIRDGQDGKIYNNPDDLLKWATDSQYMRLDNIDFDKKSIKEAVRNV